MRLNPLRLVLNNIAGNAFRSGVVFLCAALVAGLSISAALLVRGAEESLNLSLRRLGADIIAVPWGTLSRYMEDNVRLMSFQINGWMPASKLTKILEVKGVAAVTPQKYLSTVNDSPYCSLRELYLVAFDPETDFTLRPWMDSANPGSLEAGQAVVGSLISIPDGEAGLELHGYPFTIAQQMASTGTDLDQTVFISFETAEDFARQSQYKPKQALNASADTITAIMIQVRAGSDPHEVAVRILDEVPGVIPIETPGLFQSQRRQMIGMLRTVLGLLSITLVLSTLVISLVFSFAVHERRREIGMLRALGSNQRFVLKSLLTEGTLLALIGGGVGVAAAFIGTAIFMEKIVASIQIPFVLPSPAAMFVMALIGMLLALISVSLAVFIPSWKISREEVALIMRE